MKHFIFLKNIEKTKKHQKLTLLVAPQDIKIKISKFYIFIPSHFATFSVPG